MSDIKEIMAKAFGDIEYESSNWWHPDAEHRGDCTKENFTCVRCLTEQAIEEADAAIQALDAAGYQIVPKEPTEKMANCFKGSYSEGFAECMQPWERAKIYSAMLAAAKEEQNDE